jgi:membrane-bound ClpP family serine protease
MKPNVNTYVYSGIMCAIVAIFVVPEIFGSAAIILGAYAWRLDCDESRNRGLWVIVIGIVAMLVGIYYTSFFGLYNILP